MKSKARISIKSSSRRNGSANSDISENSEVKFRSIFEDAPIGIYQSTPDGRFLIVNKQLVRMLGYSSSEEVMNLDLAKDVYYNHEEREKLIGQFLANKKAMDLEVQWKKKSGVPFWISLSTYAVFNPDGTVRHFEGFVKDISLQKEAQASLFQKEEYFRSIIENSADAVALIDTAGKIQFTAQKDFMGSGSRGSAGDKFLAYIHPDDQERTSEAFRQLLSRPNERVVIMARAKHENGTWRNFEIAARNLIDNPSVKSVVANFRDVTDRTMAEERRNESERKYRQLVEQASDGIMIVDPAGILVFVNEKLCQMMGRNSLDLIGKPVSETYPPGFETAAANNLRLAQSTSAAHLDRPMQRQDGTVFPVEISVRKLPNGNFQGIVRDVTDRKKTEKALRESEEKYRSLFTHLLNGFAHCQMVFEGEKPVDFIYLDVNESFERLTGLKNAVGKKFSELIPGAREANPEILEIYGRVAATGIPEQFETYLDPLKMWFSISVYSPKKGNFVAVFDVITERKQAEQSLRESEEKFRSLAEESPNMIFINCQGKVVYANKRCEEIMGYTREELTSPAFDFRRLIDPESMPIVQKHLLTHQQGRNVAPYEYGLVKKNGEKVFGLHSTRLINYDGKEAILGIITDVTDQRKAAETQRKLLTAVEQSHDVIFMTDVNGTITYVNPSFERVYGIKREEAIGKTPRIIKSGRYSHEYYASFWKTLLEGGNVQSVVTNRTRTGHLLDMEVSVSRVLSADGSILGFLAVQTDITKKKEAEDKVREQAALLDIATDAIAVVDKNGKILFWNKSAERLYGWLAADAADRILHEAMNCEKTEIMKALVATLQRGSWEGELSTCSRDGRSVVVQSRWTLRNDTEGHPKSILVVNSDITERKVLQKQFYHSQRLDSLGTLAGGIAHDLNNVLSPILLSFEVLGRFVKEEQPRKLLKTALDSATRGKHIVSQVLTFARGAEGKKGPVQLRHLIDEAMNIIKETFPKSIEIDSSTQKDLWTVNADPTQIHQVIMNLVVNARDAMPRGGLLSLSAQNIGLDEFFCRTQLRAHPGRYVVLTVSDTGSGIPADILERIFDPFFTTKEMGKGTGLGLSTVHTIVNSHEGFVDVTTAVGHGTSFKIYLPATTQESTDESGKQRTDSPSPAMGERILVIDDERAIREITEQVLISSGYQVVTAGDGIEAIALFAERAGDFDVVLTDLMMPMMDGIATVRALRRIRSDLVVIAMSGMMADENMFLSQEFKPQLFLTKPFTAETLLQAIEKVLKSRR